MSLLNHSAIRRLAKLQRWMDYRNAVKANAASRTVLRKGKIPKAFSPARESRHLILTRKLPSRNGGLFQARIYRVTRGCFGNPEGRAA